MFHRALLCIPLTAALILAAVPGSVAIDEETLKKLPALAKTFESTGLLDSKARARLADKDDEPEVAVAPALSTALGKQAEEVSTTSASADPVSSDVHELEHAGDGESSPADLAVVWRFFKINPRSAQSSRGSARDCPAAPTCPAYRIGRARWPTDSGGRVVMPYKYSDAGRPDGAPSAGAVRSALRRSAAEWNRWNSNTVFSDAGTTSASFNARGSNGSCDDGTNVVTWRRLGPGALGATAICYDRRTMQIRDVDTALNSSHSWAIFGGPSASSQRFDVEAILTHELGHWLSLFDLRSRLREGHQTMYEAAEPGRTWQRTLALGDILGSQAAYPCGSGDRCPRSGIARD